jgi:hypothetical protein
MADGGWYMHNDMSHPRRQLLVPGGLDLTNGPLEHQKGWKTFDTLRRTGSVYVYMRRQN